MFKVVADQLKVSQGWARCGNCSEVFDASRHLQPPNPEPLLALLPEVLHQPAEPKTSAVGELSTLAVGLAEEEPARNEPEVLNPVPLPDSEVRDPGVLASMPIVDSAPKSTNVEVVYEPAVVFHDVSFLRQARRQAFWQKNSVRTSTALLGLILLALLGVQWVLQHKNSLALMDARWSAVLQAVCQPLKCAVEPLRRLESLVIDSSSFSKSGSESFRLSFVLKNTADLPLEAPLLELTLTDMQDKAILRRVLTPRQFGYVGGTSLAPQSETAGLVSLGVVNEANRLQAVSAAAVAGYRVLVFYP